MSDASEFGYSKLKAIGKGSFGLVYLVRHTRTAEVLVLKEIPLKGLLPKDRRETENEVNILRRLKHENIVKYRDSLITSNHQLCILMEFCDGGDLAGLISQRKRKGVKFTQTEVTSIVLGLLRALAYCHHELKLLHRDLKPQNVFIKGVVTESNPIQPSQIKLGDFGISKTLAISHGLAETQCGTPLYMSPEMCRGEQYDKAADIWALGCIVYELMILEGPHLRQLGRKGMVGGVRALIHHISSNQLHIDRIDRRDLRMRYSQELCALLLALTAPVAAQRPSLRSVLCWPIFKSPAPMEPSELLQPSERLAEYDVEAAMPISSQEEAADKIMRSFKRSRDRSGLRNAKNNQDPPRYAAVKAAIHAELQIPPHPEPPELRPHAPNQRLRAPSQLVPRAAKAEYNSQVAPKERFAQAGFVYHSPNNFDANAAANQISRSFRNRKLMRDRQQVHAEPPASQQHVALAEVAQRYRAAKAAVSRPVTRLPGRPCESPDTAVSPRRRPSPIPRHPPSPRALSPRVRSPRAISPRPVF